MRKEAYCVAFYTNGMNWVCDAIYEQFDEGNFCQRILHLTGHILDEIFHVFRIYRAGGEGGGGVSWIRNMTEEFQGDFTFELENKLFWRL